MRKNCWLARECGREPGGNRTHELGVCPAAEPGDFEGFNKGVNAGRYCWMIEGTLCHDQIQGNWATKIRKCIDCDFFIEVREQEGDSFRI